MHFRRWKPGIFDRYRFRHSPFTDSHQSGTNAWISVLVNATLYRSQIFWKFLCSCGLPQNSRPKTGRLWVRWIRWYRLLFWRSDSFCLVEEMPCNVHGAFSFPESNLFGITDIRSWPNLSWTYMMLSSSIATFAACFSTSISTAFARWQHTSSRRYRSRYCNCSL